MRKELFLLFLILTLCLLSCSRQPESIILPDAPAYAEKPEVEDHGPYRLVGADGEKIEEEGFIPVAGEAHAEDFVSTGTGTVPFRTALITNEYKLTASAEQIGIRANDPVTFSVEVPKTTSIPRVLIYKEPAPDTDSKLPEYIGELMENPGTGLKDRVYEGEYLLDTDRKGMQEYFAILEFIPDELIRTEDVSILVLDEGNAQNN